jgi:hypothetical protein
MFRDFIYLDINRVQSIIAQLQQGLLNEVMEGKTEQTTGRMQMALNLLAMLLPVSASGSVEHSRGASLSESRVLHDYAFEAARGSLEDEGLLVEADDLDWDEIPETGVVLVRGETQILDYETFRKIAENIDGLEQFFNPLPASATPAQKKKRKAVNQPLRESSVLMETFYKDAIRAKITNPQGCGFIGPLAREHLRDNIQDLIYKHGSRPKGEWTMLAEISRVPLPEDSSEESMNRVMQQSELTEGGSMSGEIEKVIAVLNAFQEFIGSASYPDIAVSPIAVYREVG